MYVHFGRKSNQWKRYGRIRKEGVGGRFDQNTLYMCMKYSDNRRNVFDKKVLKDLFFKIIYHRLPCDK